MISNELVRNDEASNITGRMQNLSSIEELRERNNERLKEAIKRMGKKWILHSSNRVERKNEILN
jgi:hypothetical protein